MHEPLPSPLRLLQRWSVLGQCPSLLGLSCGLGSLVLAVVSLAVPVAILYLRRSCSLPILSLVFTHYGQRLYGLGRSRSVSHYQCSFVPYSALLCRLMLFGLGLPFKSHFKSIKNKLSSYVSNMLWLWQMVSEEV